MDSALIRKLCTFADLTEDQKRQLGHLCSDVRTVSARADIVSEGERPDYIHLIVDGWAVRYKSLANGLRPISAILLPGDLLDEHVDILGQMDHSVRALTRCKVAFIKSDKLEALAAEDNLIARAFWWSMLVDVSTLRSWIVSLAGRDAYERIAHLLCEIHFRLQMLGLVNGGCFDLPLTQDDIADATGVTPVHTNRMLQRLRADNLIELASKRLTVLNIFGLQEAAGFDPSYLHAVRRLR